MGSNPTLSAKQKHTQSGVFFVCMIIWMGFEPERAFTVVKTIRGMVLAVDRRFFEAYIKILEIVLKKSRGEIPLPTFVS